MQFFVLFLMIMVVFSIVEYEISHFFAVLQFNSTGCLKKKYSGLIYDNF